MSHPKTKYKAHLKMKEIQPSAVEHIIIIILPCCHNPSPPPHHHNHEHNQGLNRKTCSFKAEGVHSLYLPKSSYIIYFPWLVLES
jgi:hypothetical protein